MKEAISATLKGDYEAVILAGASAVTSGASEMAVKFSKALMKNNGQGGEVQHHRDSHGQGQNNGSEQKQRRAPTGGSAPTR